MGDANWILFDCVEDAMAFGRWMLAPCGRDSFGWVKEVEWWVNWMDLHWVLILFY